MLVISDTSPLRALSVIETLHLIRDLYGQVLIPPAVAAELGVLVKGLPLIVPDQIVFLRQVAPKNVGRVDELLGQLNRGEAEAIALAVELRAKAILIDERNGRLIAASLGVRPIGFLGILAAAKSAGLVSTIAPLIARAQATIDFRLDPALVERVLRIVGEA